jgi:hypothetical protein
VKPYESDTGKKNKKRMCDEDRPVADVVDDVKWPSQVRTDREGAAITQIAVTPFQERTHAQNIYRRNESSFFYKDVTSISLTQD